MSGKKTRSALALGAGTVVLAAIAVLGVASLAGAQTSDSGSAPSADQASDGSSTRPHRPALTDDQRQCLADHGITPPTPAADGTRTPPTDDQRAAFRAAAEACGLPVPSRGPGGLGGPGAPGAPGATTTRVAVNV